MNPDEKNGFSKAPQFVTALEQVLGGATQSAFGSGVFYQPPQPNEGLDLAGFAKERYRFFCGSTWDRFGESAWMSTWKRVYSRPNSATANVLQELESLSDPMARNSAVMLWEASTECELVRSALQQAFDQADSLPQEFEVYRIGDGEAMSGVLLAASYSEQSQLVVTFLMD